jgi:hypothetical protein
MGTLYLKGVNLVDKDGQVVLQHDLLCNCDQLSEAQVFA